MHAAVYDLLNAPSERAGLRERRRRLVAPATGQVLEVGAGTGANIEHYDARRVQHLTMLEPDAAMRRRLLERVAAAPVPVTVHEATLEEAAGSYDTVVSTFVLCSVPDLGEAVSAIRRLLTPEGRLLFLEHSRALGVRRAAQRAAAPLWRRAFNGCDPARDPLAALRAGGLFVSDLERFKQRLLPPVVNHLVHGVARLPPTTTAAA